MADDLAEVQTRIINDSGRQDLTAGSYARLNQYIVEAQRLLERHPLCPDFQRWYRRDIAANQVLLTVPACRAILEVWCMDGDERWKLDRQTLADMREVWNEAKGDITASTPTYWGPAVLGLAPAQESLDVTGADIYTAQFTYDADDVLFADQGTWYSSAGVLFMPPADGVYTLSVLGKFRATELSTGTDKNYWTENCPEALVLATLQVVEARYRNQAGAQAWKNQLDEVLWGLYCDSVESESAEVDQFAG